MLTDNNNDNRIFSAKSTIVQRLAFELSHAKSGIDVYIDAFWRQCARFHAKHCSAERNQGENCILSADMAHHIRQTPKHDRHDINVYFATTWNSLATRGLYVSRQTNDTPMPSAAAVCVVLVALSELRWSPGPLL